MEETSQQANSQVHHHQEEPLRPSSASPGPPPSKRSAPGIENQQTLPSISSMRAEITSTDCDTARNTKDPSPEIITGDLNSLAEVSTNNLSRDYSNGNFMQQQHDDIQLDHQSTNHQQQQQQQRPLIPFQTQQLINPASSNNNNPSTSYYNFQNELVHQQQPPQVTPTHTQHHMGWMQQQQQQQQQMLQSQLLQQQASYHDHNYNAGVHVGLPHLLSSSSVMSSSSSNTNNNNMTQGNNAVTSTSPPETSGMNFYNPQSPYYGIHPQHHHHHQSITQPITQQSASSSSSSMGGTNTNSNNSNINNNGSGFGQVSQFAYPQLPLMQMNQNFVGGGATTAVLAGHPQQSQSNFQTQHHHHLLRTPQHSNSNKLHHNHHQIQNSTLMASQQQMSLGEHGGGNGGNGNKSPWALTTESPYPGGLEVLWREVPEECQKLMNLQDVPETARQRGYFTVCELIALKRSLVSRMGHHDQRRTVVGPSNPSNQEQVHRSHSDAISAAPEMSSTMVGMAVKDAMNTLHGEVSNSTEGQTVGDTDNSDVPNDGSEMNLQNSGGKCHYNAADSSTFVLASGGPQGGIGCHSSSKRHSDSSTLVNGPPPPYRTATLVFKLLVIGGYQFRSFSEVNPNRLRVLFNTQRLTYECQLSIVRPPREGMPVLRKLLTVDIGFDQISVIRFGTDKLFLRVEGPPLLTVTYNPANEDLSCPPLSQQDHHLLEQIDKGQLKLSPCHQLYFLNERLVHLLEYQFKELPRFRHILQEGFNDQQQMISMPSSSQSNQQQQQQQQQQNQNQSSIIDIP